MTDLGKSQYVSATTENYCVKGKKNKTEERYVSEFDFISLMLD